MHEEQLRKEKEKTITRINKQKQKTKQNRITILLSSFGNSKKYFAWG